MRRAKTKMKTKEKKKERVIKVGKIEAKGKGGYPKGKRLSEEHRLAISAGRQRWAKEHKKEVSTRAVVSLEQESANMIAAVRLVGSAFGHALGLNLGNAFMQGFRTARSSQL